MKERILEIFSDLMAMRSTTYSERENEPAEYFGQFFNRLPYFKINPEHTGIYRIPGDPFGRKIPYGFLKGKRKDTVVLSGHFDVVSAEEYGAAEDLAYEPFGGLTDKLSQMNLDERAKKDLKSGEWIWGRGSCDMKGGLAVHAALFEKYAALAADGSLEGSIIFMLVPDEESYSAGMRSGAELLADLKTKYGLNYKLLIDPEPTALRENYSDEGFARGESQVMSIGSVGKCMPALLVQGKKGHAGHFFDGLSAISIISSIFSNINGSYEFCDIEENEITMPPTWFKLRDMKEVYDVSIPHRACGYFTVFSFNSTPENIIEKIVRISNEAFEEETEKLNALYSRYNRACGRGEARISFNTKVLTFTELTDMLKKKRGKASDDFYKKLKEGISEKVKAGALSYPDATLLFMEKAMDFAEIQEPAVLIGFAPPYYSPVHGDKVLGKTGFGTKAFELVERISREKFGRSVVKENYFMGISDLSYTAVTSPFEYGSYFENAPLWGENYSINFDKISQIAIPSVIYGPIGLEYHQYTERVNKKSLLEEVPYVTEKLIEYMWSL